MKTALSVSALLSTVCVLAHTAPAQAAGGVETLARANPSQSVKFEVFLPLRNESGLETLLADQQNPASANYHKWLSPSDFGKRFGPTATAMDSVHHSLEAAGLKVSAMHTRSMQVSGTVAAVEQALGTRLGVKTEVGAHRMVATTKLNMSATLHAAGAIIVDFSNRPLAHSMAVRANVVIPESRRGSNNGYYYNDMKQAYDYPSYTAKVKGKKLDGTGSKTAILITNDVLDSDIQAMFDHEHFTATTGKPAPTIKRLLVNGGAPFDPSLSFEASLDTQQVISGAPGTDLTLVNIPTLSDTNIISGYLAIVESNNYDIVNSSFGGCELFYSPAYNNGVDQTGVLRVFDSLFMQGNAQGITFVASSGDNGGLECPSPDIFSTDPAAAPVWTTGVSFPAHSPHVTAVGGGNLITQFVPGTLKSKYVRESAFGNPLVPYNPFGIGNPLSGGYWGAGGGISTVFKRPDYQKLVNTNSKMRTLPDVGMFVGGCPGIASSCTLDDGFDIIWDNGSRAGVIGTSVASPEFVGALALLVQFQGGRLGNVNTFLYTQAKAQNTATGPQPAIQPYHRNNPGFDGVYGTDFPTKYNYIYGNGSPDIRALFNMDKIGPAGVPQTPTNP